MSVQSRGRASSAILAAAWALAFVLGSGTGHGQTMSVSVPSLRLASNERVGGFEIHITSGRVAAVPKVPIGWDVSINNDPSWNTLIKGSLMVGAAALDASFFRNFLIIEKRESLGGPPFEIKGEIVVSGDFATERRIKIALRDLRMTDLAPRRVMRPK